MFCRNSIIGAVGGSIARVSKIRSIVLGRRTNTAGSTMVTKKES